MTRPNAAKPRPAPGPDGASRTRSNDAGYDVTGIEKVNR